MSVNEEKVNRKRKSIWDLSIDLEDYDLPGGLEELFDTAIIDTLLGW